MMRLIDEVRSPVDFGSTASALTINSVPALFESCILITTIDNKDEADTAIP